MNLNRLIAAKESIVSSFRVMIKSACRCISRIRCLQQHQCLTCCCINSVVISALRLSHHNTIIQRIIKSICKLLLIIRAATGLIDKHQFCVCWMMLFLRAASICSIHSKHIWVHLFLSHIL